jgi:hypothetical protein
MGSRPHFETNPQTLRDYVKLLNALREPNLCDTHWKNGQGFRFIWSRTFHNPMLVSLEIHQDGTGLVHYKRLSGQGGFDLGHLTMDRTRRASIADVTPETGLDGAMWVMEGIKDGKCRIVERWSGPNRVAHGEISERYTVRSA